MTRFLIRGIATSLLLAMSLSAEAHPLHDTHALREGFLHPWFGWDHLLAMLAVGWWAAQQSNPRDRWYLPLGFVSAVGVGAWAGSGLGPMAWVEPGIVLSLIALGLLVALRGRMNLLPAVLLLLPMGLVHGWAHGVELPPQASLGTFAFGFLSATALLHLLGVSVAATLTARGALPLLRLGGAGVAVSGCALLLA